MHAPAGRRQAPYAPPLVALSSGQPAHLLAWELLEATGDWQAWVSWVQTAGGHHAHQVTPVRAAACSHSKTRTPTARYPAACTAGTGSSGHGPVKQANRRPALTALSGEPWPMD